MNVTQSVASRSRDVGAARFFLPPSVISAESSGSSASPHGWKFTLQIRIWSEDGPKGNAARSVLSVLLWNSDGMGRTWLGVHAIMEKSGLGNERTVRRALDVLANGGWLKVTAQTWSSLTAEQIAAGRKPPRRGDVGQAPNLYTVLATPDQTVTPNASTHPGLTRTVGNPAEDTPRQICRGGQGQISRGGPGANLPPDPYPLGSVSKEVREERVSRSGQSTHLFSEVQQSKGEWDWLNAWNVLVHAHAEKTMGVYGVAPLPPDLRRDDRRAVAECLEGTATELAAKLRDRGIERELVQVRQDLAARVMALYFKRDNEHLRRVKHALRDLPREFHARITEAMQAILRESHDVASVPRRTPELEAPAPETTAEKAVETTKSEAAEKPLPAQKTSSFARQVLEMLGGAKEETPQRKASEPSSTAQDKARKQAQQSEGVTEASENASPAVQRSKGRLGAPRWGALAPTPTKIRRVSRLQVHEPDEAVESVEPHPRE